MNLTNRIFAEMKDLPQDITPIKSARNKYGYEGIVNKTDRGWKVKLYLKENLYYFLGPFNCLEIAAKMYGETYPIFEELKRLRLPCHLFSRPFTFFY